MPKKITPCLLYTKNAAAAARYYVSIFKDSKIYSSDSMATRFRIGGMDFIAINGPASDRRHPGNISLLFPGHDAHSILGALQPHLAASTGSACSSGTPQPSHVLREIGMTDAEAEATIRFSLGRFTTAEEIDEAADHIARVVARHLRVEATGS